MGQVFSKHYTREQARALLPSVRSWLETLRVARRQLEVHQEQTAPLLAAGHDLGGDGVERWVLNLAKIQSTLTEFQGREIQIKDLDRGLVDFPAILGGREVFLCWEEGEEDIDYWHDLDAGYAGREKLG